MPEQLDFTGQVAVITDGTGGSDAMANRVCIANRAYGITPPALTYWVWPVM